MVTFTAPFVPVLVVMLVSCDKFSKSCSRWSLRSFALPPLNWATEICLFKLAMSESSVFAEPTSLLNDEFNELFTSLNCVLIWLNELASCCAAPTVACWVLRDGAAARLLNALNSEVNWPDKPESVVPALVEPVLLAAPVPLRNSFSPFCALCNAVCCEFQ